MTGTNSFYGKYDLIALDMDETALNHKKEMTPETKLAIHEALSSGKEVVFCTGRALAEMRAILEDFPDMHYLVAESGGLLYDLRKEKILYSVEIGRSDILLLKEAAEGKDIMPVAFSSGRYTINRRHYDRLPDFHMAAYVPISLPGAFVVEDILDGCLKREFTVEKILMLHLTPEERTVTRKFLEERHTSMVCVDAEVTSLECSPMGISKGSGLATLSELIGISTERMIMVGDADNDLEGLRCAGLAVAMGNANENVKRESDVVVADNEHDGCAEAIRRYLLGKDEGGYA